MAPPWFEHVLHEVAARDPLAHEPTLQIGERDEHGVDLAALDELHEQPRVRAFRLP